MANMNQWIGAGNLTRQPEIRQTNGGNQVAVMGMAVNRNFKRGDQWEQETTFVDVESWVGLDVIAHLGKGSPVLVEGRLAMDQWEDRNTGEKRSKHKIVVQRIQSLTPRNAGNQQPPPQQPQHGYAPPQAPPPQAPYYPTPTAPPQQQAPPPPRPAGQQPPPPPQFPAPPQDDAPPF